MATADELERLRALVFAGPEPTWETPSDLNQMSVQASLLDAGASPRRASPTGRLRMHTSAMQNAVSFSGVSSLLAGFQQLVTAVGAANQGVQHLVGRIPDAVIRNTTLTMVREPLAGSVVVEFAPANTAPVVAPENALFDLRDAQGEEEPSIAPLAVERALGLITAASTIGSDPDQSAFVREIAELGPRTATACRSLMKSLGSADFDLDVTWRSADGQSPRKATITRAQAAYVGAVFKARELDVDHVTITGRLHSASYRSPLEIVDDEGAMHSIGSEGLTFEDIDGLVIGRTATVRARAIQRARFGRETGVKLVALSISQD